MSRDYFVVIEQASDDSYSAHVPDLPGCVSCGETVEEVKRHIHEAVRAHVESLSEHGEPVPFPMVTTTTVSIA